MKPVDVRNASILIVDDQDANVVLLEEMLRSDGYTRILSTKNPTEVCALHRENGFDLILLDLQIPVMDGFQVMEALKADAVDAYLSVIVLTAQPGYKLRALQAGAKDFISKPFDLIEVKVRIHNALEVRLLYKELKGYAAELEQRVQQRTAELEESEARYRGLTELASDWYWEQDDKGNFTKVSGPVQELLGIQTDTPGASLNEQHGGDTNAAERSALHNKIAARESFLDFAFTRTRPDGTRQAFRVSGQPMFDRACTFIGYRGIGVETTPTGSAGNQLENQRDA
jgi:PAS domain S-box-containing protein